MTLITPEYLALQRELHARVPYGTGGHKWAKEIRDIAERIDARSVLDYGSGHGLLGKMLSTSMAFDPRFQLIEYDPAIPGKEALPEPADLIYCGDTLEHVEPECLDAVLDHLQGLTKHVVFLVISTRKAGKTLADGRNAHLIVMPASWWLSKLEPRWNVREFAGLRDELRFIGMRKPEGVPEL